jgi:hypothetical protein
MFYAFPWHTSSSIQKTLLNPIYIHKPTMKNLFITEAILSMGLANDDNKLDSTTLNTSDEFVPLELLTFLT